MEIIFGLILIGFILAIPLALLIAIFFLRNRICPVCGHKFQVYLYKAGVNCPACNTRFVVRNRNLYAPEQAKAMSESKPPRSLLSQPLHLKINWSKETILKILKWLGLGFLILLSIALAFSDLSAFFGFLSFQALVALIVGLIKPAFYKLQSRKKIALVFGGVFIVLFIVALSIHSPKQSSEKISQESQPPTTKQEVSQAETKTLLCRKEVKEIKPTSPRYPDRKYYEEIHCGDDVTTVFKLSRQLTEIAVYKDGKVQTICSSECETDYNPYDPNNVVIKFTKPPEKDSVVRITGAVALPSEMKPPQPPTLGKIIFDIPTLAGKMSYTTVKSILGKPTREGLPDPMLDMDGWAEWDKEGFTLSINYNRYGVFQNSGGKQWYETEQCALGILPKKGYLAEDQLRLAGNLPQNKNSFIVEVPPTDLILTFSIQPRYNKQRQLYAIDVCL